MDSLREIDYKIAALIGEKLRTRGKWRGYWSSANGKLHYSHMDDGPQYFSSDIAAAWRVVEFMHTQGYVLELRYWVTYWSARFNVNHLDEGDFAKEDNAAHAICMAALRACGVEV